MESCEAIEARLRTWCVEHDRLITPVGDVDEATAAALLGVADCTLRAWIREGRSPVQPSRMIAGRRRYALREIVQYLCDSQHFEYPP
ncbi:hypothetical protein AB4Y35_07385 [Paraburkholderia sp. EG286A]|uniref:hypothetical protein n=1 Tax=Paraburkholderia sp. EG286A TaxID=3237014 RepID=UPI0034D38BC3